MNQSIQNTTAEATRLEAFEYLKGLPPYNHPGGRSEEITPEDAKSFTDTFRSITETFTIPVSWSIDKAALINLLGITSHTGYSAINGIRLYAGVNEENQLTLIAVTTTDTYSGTDDLTVEDEYPYYDYANPCPNMCSNTGNLKAVNAQLSDYMFTRTAAL